MKKKILSIILLSELTVFATDFSALNSTLSDCFSNFYEAKLIGSCSGFCKYRDNGCFYECKEHFTSLCQDNVEQLRANALKRAAERTEKENRLKPTWDNEIKKRKEAGKFVCLQYYNNSGIQTAIDVQTDNDVRTKMYEIKGEDALVSFVHKIGIFHDETYIRNIWPLRRCVIDDNNFREKFGYNNKNSKLLEYVDKNTLGGDITPNELSKETKDLLIKNFIKDFNE